jgi:hypothetical protein
VEWTSDYTLLSGTALEGPGLYKVSGGTLSVNGEVPVQNLDLKATLGGTNTLTVSNLMNWTAGQMLGDGRTVIAPGATLVISNTAELTLNRRTLENAGAVFCDGTGIINCLDGTVLTNRLGAVWELRSDQNFMHWSGTGSRFDNTGIFRKSQGTGISTFSGSLTFNNYKTLSVWQGNLSFLSLLNLYEAGEVEFSIGGADYPLNYGRITASQALQVAGCLTVTFRNSYTPEPAQHYDVIAATILGTFQCYSAPPISSYVFMNPVYSPNLVQLVTTDPTPHFLRLTMDAQPCFTLEISGIANETYLLQASTNLFEWTPLATNSMPASTVWRFVDEDSANLPYRFYRAAFLP